MITTKKCSLCGKQKTIDNFYKGNLSWCKVCMKARIKQNDFKARKKMIEGFGGKCSCCGESNFEFLQLNHQHGGGTHERKTIGSKVLIRKLIKDGFPSDGYNLLCANCNTSEGLYGYCPHDGRPVNYDDPYRNIVKKRPRKYKVIKV